MKQSLSLYYQVKNLHFDNVLVFLIKWHESHLTKNKLENLRNINGMHCTMINNALQLRSIDFLKLKLPRQDYAEQTAISSKRVDLATASSIHYGLNTGMVIRYLKGEYVRESRDANAILATVSPHINDGDCQHIKRIINQGCPSNHDFEEEYENKHMVLWKGNQHAFLQHPEVTAKTMNKEEKNSHVLPFKTWVVYFPPYCPATLQGIQEKHSKF
jgi:hypothetical protein